MDGFERLTPERIIGVAEAALGVGFTGILLPLASYINRVYELEAAGGERFVFKFYRPGRWERGALLEEHLFVLECRGAEIPVVAPLPLSNGLTLGEVPGGGYFAAYPKRWGRVFESRDDESFRRLGMLLARMHLVGERREAPHRLRLDPRESTLNESARLLSSGVADGTAGREFGRVLKEVLRELLARFRPGEAIRLHGDCHKGNILERPGEGLMLIDFDDMLTGPPVQDLWLLLPGGVEECKRELDLLLEGYESLRAFDRRSLDQIELLRAMRLIYFLDWCARQRGDVNFEERYPGWGSDSFWRAETETLYEQLERIRNA